MLYDPKWENKAKTDSAIGLLIEARKLLNSPDKWCIGSQGRTVSGKWANPWDDECVSRCALGAISAVATRHLPIESRHLIGCDHPAAALLSKQMDGAAVGPWNNSHTYEEVVAAFDRAIAQG